MRLTAVILQAYFRGAKAALKLDEIETACRLCEQGLKSDPGNKELEQLQQVDPGIL